MIKQALASLDKNQSALLKYAFENGYSQYIELENGMFIGVNCQSVPHLKITESVGLWAYGSIKSGD